MSAPVIPAKSGTALPYGAREAQLDSQLSLE